MTATGMHFKWVRPPRHLAQEVNRYGQKVLVAVHAVAAYVGQQMQDQARANAPWQDRTANARSGLMWCVDGFGLAPMCGTVSAGALAQMKDTATVSGDKDRLVITLGHTVFYGRYLETIGGGKWAVVMSTIEANLGTLERMLRSLLQ